NQHWQALEAQAQKQGWSYGKFLMTLCEYEQQQRDERRIQRYLKDSKPRGVTKSNALHPSYNEDFVGTNHTASSDALSHSALRSTAFSTVLPLISTLYFNSSILGNFIAGWE
ncbi:MAG: ATP-binding protein, partial [Cyanobacteria bacterium P01_G01_bin.19]